VRFGCAATAPSPGGESSGGTAPGGTGSSEKQAARAWHRGRQSHRHCLRQNLREGAARQEEGQDFGGAGFVNDEKDDDAPFTVEYSPTGRATCRRCDQVIPRDCLRVSHIPLFRGKPGYKVYRHLDCTVFSEQIYCVQDVGGYRKLREPDLDRLRERIVASRKEWEDEKKEIQPDELVQLAFSGPVRPAPVGLCANLLPFQVEGASWMHAQEHSDVRGGILADEMGMVRSSPGRFLQLLLAI
jgi:hypothetical protein